jgi:hypothetical protein
MEATLIKKNF